MLQSSWEKEVFGRYDVIIVGAGITGLSTAISLKEKNHGISVCILERGSIPSGASTKNAGFACFGSVTELLEDLQILGEAKMIELVSKRWQGLNTTRKRLGDEAIDLRLKGGYELMFDELESGKIEKVNNLLEPLFQESVFELSNEKITPFGFGSTRQLIFNKFEGQLHPGKLISSLWELAGKMSIRIITGAEVKSVYQDKVVVENGDELSARAVVLCTNGFSQQLAEVEFRPGRGMVLHVGIDKKLPFAGTFHYDAGYYYFRDYNGDLIFGGGRNLAMDQEETTSFGINQEIREKLIEDLEKIILPGRNYEIRNEWSGIMAFGDDKYPTISHLDNGVFLGAKLGGMGVALGSQVGEELSKLILMNAF